MYDFEEEKNQNNLKSFQVHIFTFQNFLHLFTFKKEKTIKLRTGDAPPPQRFVDASLSGNVLLHSEMFLSQNRNKRKIKKLKVEKGLLHNLTKEIRPIMYIT